MPATTRRAISASSASSASCLLVATLAVSTTGATPAATSTESQLNARWRGAWTVLGVEAMSGCGGNYTNNEIRERRVSAKGEYRFGPGELATVYKINVKRKQVEVLVDLAEPLLAPRQEGPFTLYDTLHCKVELQIKFPPGVSSRSTSEVDELIAAVLERHDGAGSAEKSASWNGRRREPFPDDYEDTLYEYEHWRAEQVNAEVAAEIEDAIEEAARRVDRLGDDPDYLDGFAKGVARARKKNFDKDCERLLSASRSAFVKSESGDHGRAFRDGYREGQELVFFLERARRLRRCFVPPPL